MQMTQEIAKPFSISQLDPSWRPFFEEEFKKPYMKELSAFVAQERGGEAPIYPAQNDVFNAFLFTPYDQVRVVIIGQDPYHGPGQAHGLCFSVPHGIPLPPSLQNIFKEIKEDLQLPLSGDGCLIPWAKQGVLLLNATLTVSEKKPLSHHKRGWERFTDEVVKAICQKQEPVIFVLWGKSAQAKCIHVMESTAGSKGHILLKAPHPSPLSAYQGFFGCRHFSTINRLLQERGEKPIDWRV